MDKSVLICVPTCNRPEMVREVLEYESDYYAKLGINVCYYDSGDSEETKIVIEEFVNKGYNNIFYRRIERHNSIDVKLFYLLKDDDLFRKYDYFWLINDSVSIQEEALQQIKQLINKDFDILRLPLAGAGEVNDQIFDNADKWFHDASYGMAHMASTIMKSSILDNCMLDWNYLYDTYIKNDDIYSDIHGCFFTIGLYLEAIAKLDSFKGIFIGNRIKWRRDSTLKKDNIYWKNIIFSVWARSYTDTIMDLPECFTQKEEVIKKSDNIAVGRFSDTMLIQYRINGIFDKNIYKQYKRYFELVSDVPQYRIYCIAYSPRSILSLIYGKKCFLESDWNLYLEDIEKEIHKYDGIIIYGAGLYGERTIKKLKKDGFEDEIRCVAVSDSNHNIDFLEGVKVCGIDDIGNELKKCLVIIATLPNTAKQIKKILKKNNFKNIVLLF